MDETLNQKLVHWRREASKLRDQLNENKFTKTTTKDEKLQKRQQDLIEVEMVKIMVILDTIERLVELERLF